MNSTGWVVQGILLADGFKWRFVFATLGLVVALLLGALIIAMVERWRKRAANSNVTAGDQLTHFRQLYDQGAMSKEEYDRVRAQLAGDLRKELNLGPNPASAATQVSDVPTLSEPPRDGQAPAP